MNLYFLGSLSNKFDTLLKLIKDNDIRDAYIIHTGGLGLGQKNFNQEFDELELINKMLANKNIFFWSIRGDGDLKKYFDTDIYSLSNIKLIKDYDILYLNGLKILCIGGSISIDRRCKLTTRQKMGDNTLYGDESWWPDEELVYDDKIKFINDIDVLVSNTANTTCYPNLATLYNKSLKFNDETLYSDVCAEARKMETIIRILTKNTNMKQHIFGKFNLDKTITKKYTGNKSLKQISLRDSQLFKI